MESTRSKDITKKVGAALKDTTFKKLINGILARKGLGPVKNWAVEFSDGCKFCLLLHMQSFSKNYSTFCTVRK